VIADSAFPTLEGELETMIHLPILRPPIRFRSTLLNDSTMRRANRNSCGKN